MSSRIASAVYIYALKELDGIGTLGAIRIAMLFPDRTSLENAALADIRGKLNPQLSVRVIEGLDDQWPRALVQARMVMSRCEEKGVIPLPISDGEYPLLLKLIHDPPIILYIKGSVSTVAMTDSVAVVGTREPTRHGKEIARRIAGHLGRDGFLIVSGLAKGVDTSAHLGALEANAKTLAVIGTPVDKTYPAENKALASEITARGGALVSEIEVGGKTHRAAFVARDRVQSGLSLGVIPVQTGIEGGTMHTVRFAQEQERLLFCPQPLKSEQYRTQYTGILELIRQGKAKAFDADDYSAIVADLREHKKRLVSMGDGPRIGTGRLRSNTHGQLELGFK